MIPSYDVAVVGAGVLGLAHAYHLAKSGRRVAVFERHPRAQGASIRNFGMLWPIGQPDGPLLDLANRSLAIWREILQASGLWHAPVGSLHLAYHDDEAQVLREFLDRSTQNRSCEWLSPQQIATRFPAIVSHGLRGGLFSSTEVTVDPRQIIAELPNWLHQTFGVAFHFETQALAFDRPTLVTTRGDWLVERTIVCTGADFREIAPEAFASAGLVPCKLQMMRTIPYGDRFPVGTMLAGGLTLRHYKSFANCPTLPALANRLDAELPDYGRYGIHVLLSQNQSGELILGDSHEYGPAIEPFDKSVIDDLVLRYLRTMIEIPDLRIAARWHGVYAKHPTEAFLIADPRPGLRAVTGVGGAGMTLSFGLAEHAINTWMELP